MACMLILNQSVSIHALLAECDRRGRPVPCPVCRFNPRTPCGVRPIMRGRACMPTLFQSTHSLRSATLVSFGIVNVPHGFNPRTPCGVRLQNKKQFDNLTSFNPRTPCGVRLVSFGIVNVPCGFNPRTPCGVRQPKQHYIMNTQIVSIHALLAECDCLLGFPKMGTLVSIHALLAECDCAQPYTLLLNKANHTLRQPP